MPQFPICLFLVIPTLAAAVQIACARRPRAQRHAGLLATGMLAGLGGALVLAVREHGPVSLEVGAWIAPIGIELRADMLSALMLTITGVVGFCGAIHALAEVPARDERKGYHALYQFLLLGVCGSFLTNDLFNLYVWFEVMLLASFVLIALGGAKAQTEGAVKYVILNILASVIFLVGIALVYGTLGTLNFSDIAQRMAGNESARAGIRLSAVFLLVAFAVKAGMFPLYAWLPSSYHTPRHTVSAVFAGLLTKVGVYALIRTFGTAFVEDREFLMPVLWVASLLTMVAGVLGAASQYHTRRILSFHIISQIGYMTLGLALGTLGAIAAAIFYVIHHILVKTNLFFAASAIDRVGGGEHLKETGGLYRRAPWLAALFLVSALSLGGIPPFSGFWAKLALVREIIGVHEWLAVTVALGVGLLTLFSMTKIWAEAFWKERPEHVGPVQTIGIAHVIPMVLLASGTIILSLFPGFLFDLANLAARQIATPPAP